MRRLLRANFSRLWRDKVFLIITALMLIAGTALPVIHFIDNQNNGSSWTLDSSFFSYGLFVPVLLSLWTAFFIGSEYSDGTMRNKIIAGHRRSNIYLANLITGIVVGMLFDIAYIAPHICIGMPLLGAFENDLSTMILYAGLNAALMTAFAALFTLIAMLCQSKAYTVAGCILLTFVLLFAGVRIISALNEPEYYEAYSYTENGVTVEEDETKNPNYLSGAKREIFEFLKDFTPGGQAIQLSNMKTEKPRQLALYDCMILVAAAGCGMIIFKRKDLK